MTTLSSRAQESVSHKWYSHKSEYVGLLQASVLQIPVAAQQCSATQAACLAKLILPLQVAETFDMDPAEDGVPSLKGKAHLDNCVTVLDAAELFNNLASIKSLKVSTPMHNAAAMQQNLATSPMQEREKGVTKEDERNIAELLLDQIEFANVILLNKQDLVLDKISRQTLMATIRTLNPEASVRFTTKCKASTPF